MRNIEGTRSRSSERGAISIKTIFSLAIVAAIIFVAIKIVPVYAEQRRLIYDVNELARIASVRNYKDDQINSGIKKLNQEYELPEDSIRLVSRDRVIKIEVEYSKDIDLLLTNYAWRVDYTAEGKSTLKD